jgi:alpha-L-arabinofuranosidase
VAAVVAHARHTAAGAALLLLLVVAIAGFAPSKLASQATDASIEIDAGAPAGRISPLLYGQFAEFMFENIKRGLHAELLRNRGFDEGAANSIGLPRYWERYPDDRNDDYGMSFALDETIAHPNNPATSDGLLKGRSLRVELRPGVVARHGVFQSRVPLRQGIEYRGHVFIRTKEFKGSVIAAIESDVAGGPTYEERDLTDIRSGDWTKYDFAFRSSASDPLARFVIRFNGSGTLWIDQVSLMPGDAVGGVRADVFEKVKALAPAFIRWPGGNVAQDYHWKWGVGPRDERPTWINLSWKNEPEPGDFGPDELVAFARAVGAEPSMTVNVEGRGATAVEAAEWVEYCNGPQASVQGRLRARNGYPDPHRVTYWEIGNEIWGDWVRGHSNAETYAKNLARYVTAMRAVDPSIKVIAVGDNDMAWNRTVLRQGGPFDYLAIHHYYGRREMQGDLRNLMARPLHYDRFYGEMDALLRGVPEARRPKLAINEWGLDLPESQQYSILTALYGARLMNVFERRSDVVAMSAVSDLVNGWPGGIIQASLHGVFVTPIYLVNKLYATHLGAERLSARVDGPTLSTSREGTNVPVLDVSVSRSADGQSIFVKAVNTDLERPLTTRISVRGAQVAPNAVVRRVVADSLQAVNGFATPEAVKITREEIVAGNTFSIEMPRHSVAVVTLTAAK